jgi:hypothetical protein
MDANVYGDRFAGDGLVSLTHRSPLIGGEPGSGKPVMAEVIAGMVTEYALEAWRLSKPDETDETASLDDGLPVGEVR